MVRRSSANPAAFVLCPRGGTMDKRKNINAVNLDVAGSINLLEVVMVLMRSKLRT